MWCKTLLAKPFSGWSKARRESVRNHLWPDCSATKNKTRLRFFCDFSQDIKYPIIWNEYPKLFSLWVKIKYSQGIRPPKLQSRTLYFATALEKKWVGTPHWGPACVCFWFPCEWIPNIFSNLPIIHIRVALRVASECYININDKVHSGTEAPFYAKWGGMENLKKSSNVIIPTMTSLQHYHQKLDNIAVSLFTNRETAMLSIENIWRNSSPISSRKTCSAPSLSLGLNFQVVKIMSKVSGAAFSLSSDCQIGGGGNLETELSPSQNLKV